MKESKSLDSIKEYTNKFKKDRKFFAENLSIYQDKKPEILYYYTSISVLDNILKNETLWLSNSKYMNDSTEINYTKELIHNICDEFLDLHSNFDKFFKKTIDNLLNNMDKDLGDTYILSLTTNRDSLALWSNYSDYDGYNVGFNSEKLRGMFDKRYYYFKDKHERPIQINDEDFLFDFGEVIYKKDCQQKILKERILFLYNIYKDYYDFIDSREFKVLVACVMYDISYISIFLKNPSFKEEEECRIVFRFINNELKNRVVNHRISNRVFIPYIKLSFKKIDHKNYRNIPIKSITIGPKNNLDIAEIGLMSFLESEKYRNLNIGKSNIPLRY